MTQVTYKRRRPVIDTLLEMVIARDLDFERATTKMFDSVGFIQKGILKYLEIEDEYLVKFETLEMDHQEVVIQVSVPDEGVDLDKGLRNAKLWTVRLPLEVISSHDYELVASFIDDMTQFEDIDNLDLLSIEDIDQLLDEHDTIKVEKVTRRMVH